MNSVSLSSGMALMFGALHVLEPGHGKTALLTYVVSEKTRWQNLIFISLSSAITHSLVVFLIAFVTHFFFHHTSIESKVMYISNLLNVASGVLICSIGVWFVLCGAKKKSTHRHCSCNHHASNHNGPSVRKKQFFTSGMLGVAAGITPCPTIVVAYILGVSSGNLSLGVQNVLLFSLGMFVSLLSFLTICSVGSEKLLQRFKVSKINLNWTLVQGLFFITLGIGVALYH